MSLSWLVLLIVQKKDEGDLKLITVILDCEAVSDLARSATLDFIVRQNDRIGAILAL